MQRVALITGCSSGIGRATARAFHAEEWSVTATAREGRELTTLEQFGCHVAELDVTNDEQIEDVVAEVIDRWGRIDCLVNNAGYAQLGPLEDVPTTRLHRQFDVNVYGPHRLTREVLPHMRARGSGTIVNVSSGLGRIALPGAGVYSGSKFALEAMTDALRAELSPLGLHAVLVEPGNVDTAFPQRASAELDTLARTDAYAGLYGLLEDWVALGGFGPAELEPQDVADTIVNAASSTQPDPRYVVGTTGWAASAARFVPGSLRDTIYRAVLRLTDIRRDDDRRA